MKLERSTRTDHALNAEVFRIELTATAQATVSRENMATAETAELAAKQAEKLNMSVLRVHAMNELGIGDHIADAMEDLERRLKNLVKSTIPDEYREGVESAVEDAMTLFLRQVMQDVRG